MNKFSIFDTGELEGELKRRKKSLSDFTDEEIQAELCLRKKLESSVVNKILYLFIGLMIVAFVYIIFWI